MADSSTQTAGSSLSAFVTSLVINGLIFLVFFILFLVVFYPPFHIVDIFVFSLGRSISESMSLEPSSALYRRSISL